MENKGAKIAIVIFTILAVIAFTVGTVLGVSLLQSGNMETVEESSEESSELIGGEELLTLIVLIAPFLLSYPIFALLDLIVFFLAIHLIKSGSKGMGTFHLLLAVAMMAVAVPITLKVVL